MTLRKEHLVGQTVLDVHVPGIIDKGEMPPDVQIFQQALFIQTRNHIIAVRLDGESNLLRLQICLKKTFEYSFEFEDSHTACFVSICSCVLGDTFGEIQNALIYNASDSCSVLSCAALELIFVPGMIVFIGTLSFDGISIGAERKKAAWMNTVNDYTVREV